MDAQIQAKLREKFDVKHIGLKPKITCQPCSKAFGKACDKHPKAKCERLRGEPGCGQWITPMHMHIEFVGHANVTDRLLEVDPEWTWEPVAFAPSGLPALTPDGGLWIRLTVAGVTRIGYGGADGKQGDDAVKEAVSDALKTTAMRFGVGLDLWRKEEASGKTADDPAPQAASEPAAAKAGSGNPDTARGALRLACEQYGWDLDLVAGRFTVEHNGLSLRNCDDALVIAKFRSSLFKLPQAELQPAALAAVNGAAQ